LKIERFVSSCPCYCYYHVDASRCRNRAGAGRSHCIPGGYCCQGLTWQRRLLLQQTLDQGLCSPPRLLRFRGRSFSPCHPLGLALCSLYSRYPCLCSLRFARTCRSLLCLCGRRLRRSVVNFSRHHAYAMRQQHSRALVPVRCLLRKEVYRAAPTCYA